MSGFASQTIGELRKSGQLDEAYAQGKAAFDAAPRDLYLQRALGWVLHDLAKREAKELGDGTGSPGRLAHNYEVWLADYRRLDRLGKPELLHSLIMNHALKGSKQWPGFLSFAHWWLPEAYRDEDRQPFVTADGKSLPSLELRVASAVSRIAVSAGDLSDEQLQAWASSFFDAALERWPDDQWLNYYKSQQLLGVGAHAEARSRILPLVRRQPRAPWAWVLLGKTYAESDSERAIVCFYEAIRVAHEPVSVVKARLALARLLANEQYFPAATCQVKKALALREEKGWQIPQEMLSLTRTPWYQELHQSTLPSEPNLTKQAEELLYEGAEGGLEQRVGVIDHQNREKRLAHVALSHKEGLVLPYHRFKGIDRLPCGTIVSLTVANGGQTALRFCMTTQEEIPGVCAVRRGTLVLPSGKPHGFVEGEGFDRVFVPPPLVAASNATPNASVRCSVVLSEDRRSGRVDWRAVALDVT